MIDMVAIFLAWLDRSRLPVRVEITDIKSNQVNFDIEGWNCLEGRLNDGGIDVFAVRDGETWDIIWNSDIRPVEFDDGWDCGFCIDAWEKQLYPKPAVYSSPEDLWIEHTLEPLRDWLEKLKKSAGVAFIDYDGATEAKLLQEGDQIPELAVEVVGRSLLIGRIDA
jgi:hypothetical protein